MTLPPLPDVLAIALDVARRLERVEVRYVIGGSLASSVHGEPRTTLDVDLVADLRQEAIAGLVAALIPDYYVDEDAARSAVRTGGTFNAVHTRAGVKIDFFVAGADASEHERLRTRTGSGATCSPSWPFRATRSTEKRYRGGRQSSACRICSSVAWTTLARS